MKQKEKSANAWLSELMNSKFDSGQTEVVPDGWMTLNEMAMQQNVSLTTINARIQRLLQSGDLQRKKFNIWTGRQVGGVWHYYKK